MRLPPIAAGMGRAATPKKCRPDLVMAPSFPLHDRRNLNVNGSAGACGLIRKTY